jgi:hypothetical protein
MAHTYAIMSVDKDGNSLSPTELFDAWVVMARDLAGSLPAGRSQDLCAAVYEAITADSYEARNKVLS